MVHELLKLKPVSKNIENYFVNLALCECKLNKILCKPNYYNDLPSGLHNSLIL